MKLVKKKRLIVKLISRSISILYMPNAFHDYEFHICATTKTYLHFYSSFFFSYGNKYKTKIVISKKFNTKLFLFYSRINSCYSKSQAFFSSRIKTSFAQFCQKMFSFGKCLHRFGQIRIGRLIF